MGLTALRCELSVSFAEYAARAGLSPIARRGFEADVRLHSNFNLRPAREWERLLSEYRTRARGRRV